MSTPVTVPRGGGHDGGEGGDVRAYVAAVRSWLDDLSAEEVEELTGGLEADLTDALAGTGASPGERFGEPRTYAEELRSAAGMAPRPDGGDRGGAWAAYEGVVHAIRRWSSPIERTWQSPRFAPVREWLLILRPIWWALRACVVFGSVSVLFTPAGWLPEGITGTFLLLALILVSVEMGRRRPRGDVARGGLLLVNVVVNVLAVLALPHFISGVYDAANLHWRAEDHTATGPSGLALDGQQIYNVFPYDSQGRPLQDVRLYDERGRPLVPGGAVSSYVDADGVEWELVPRAGLDPGRDANVYPLQARRLSGPEGEQFGPVPEVSASDGVRWPFPSLPPLLAAPTPSPTGTPPSQGTPSPEPTHPPGTTAPARPTP